MPRRTAFTLLELVVVVAIMAVVLALILPAIQQIRARSLRTQCANNLRQIILAAHLYHDAQGSFPAGIRFQDGNDQYLYMTWLTQLLPNLEHPGLWDATVRAYQQSPSPFPANNPPHVGLSTVVKVFVCPADPMAGDIHRSRVEHMPVALATYLGVEGRDYTTTDGILFRDSAVRMGEITDGTSQTLFAGERPPSPDFQYGWWYAGTGQDTSGSVDATLGVRERDVLPFSEAPCLPGPYQFAAGDATNPCDIFHFWSHHTGGANFAFADGAVRFLAYSADPLMPALASRAGGEAITVADY
jgi:prepilin-type N-terminal cleavage/methylation domain-containing protein/prepilin-type processing-associated H-X9-DG protein